MPGPDEFIALADDNPRPLLVKPKVPLNGRGDLNSGCGIRWCLVSDRQDGNFKVAVFDSFHSQNYDARPVLPSLLTAFLVFTMPEV
jgi:hypothetical protein